MVKIITSQHHLDDAIVASKIADSDFGVLVSPVFRVDGEEFRVILDGNHSFAAAIEAGVEPDLTEATASDHDAVGLLDDGDIQLFLEMVWMDGDYRDARTHKAVW